MKGMEFARNSWLSTYIILWMWRRIGCARWFSPPELTWARVSGDVYEWELIQTAVVILILEWIRYVGMRCTARACEPMSQFWLVEGEITITQCTVVVHMMTLFFVKLQEFRWRVVLKWQSIPLSNTFSITSPPVHLSFFHRVEWIEMVGAVVLGICAKQICSFTVEKYCGETLQAVCLWLSSTLPVQRQQSHMWMCVHYWFTLSATVY